MTALFDSSAWIEYFRGSAKAEVVREVLDQTNESVICSKVNVFEVYHRILTDAGKENAEFHTANMLARCSLDELPVSTLLLAVEQKRSRKLGMADAIILATALAHQARLYTMDADFRKTTDVVETVFL